MREIKLTLGKHLKDRGLRQIDFAEQTGLRKATISQLVNNKYHRIELKHLLTIMDALKITDFNEILTIKENTENTNETRTKLNKHSAKSDEI
jgi:DNA-binding Xre family transcriptional regulator